VGLGFPASLIDAIRVGAPITLDDPAERVAAAVVTELLATGDITDAAWAEGLDVLGLAVLTELTTIVGYYGLLGLQMRVFRVPLPDGAEPVVFGTP
jgi:4-carboxymuconolactone decarboxylase